MPVKEGDMEEKKAEKKDYEKPEIKKFKAVQIVGSSDSCSVYKSGANEYSYYH
jgi:hypothetical protein